MQVLADYAAECLSELSGPSPPSYSRRGGREGGGVALPKGEAEVAAERDDEEEVALLAARTRRIQRVFEMMEEVIEATSEASHVDASPFSGGAEAIDSVVRYGSQTAAAAVASLSDCVASLSGAAPRCRSDASLLSPASRPVTLQEASLSLYSANDKTVFRRRPQPQREPQPQTQPQGGTGTKRPREEAHPERQQPHCRQPPLGFFASLSEAQQTQRFGVYASRTALLPRLDTLNAVLHERSLQRPQRQSGDDASFNISPQPFYVSPAIHQLASLNLAAEREMLGHAWAVRTKAMLLVRLPGLYATSVKYRSELASLLYGADEQKQREVEEEVERRWRSASHRRASPNTMDNDNDNDDNNNSDDETGEAGRSIPPYFHFVFYDMGVVRVSLQHGLLMDVTYNLLEKGWTLLRLHWNLWVPLLSLCDDGEVLSAAVAEALNEGQQDTSAAAATAATAAHHEVSGWSRDVSVGLRRIVPTHRDAMTRYVQLRLADEGIEGGCAAATQLLCAVVMDVVAAQARRLQEGLFGAPLPRKAFTLDIRQGTHVSLLVNPPLTTAGQREPVGEGASGGPGLMMRLRMVGGTVVLERAWTGSGAATNAREVSRVLEPVKGERHKRVVLDVEGMLWDTVLRGNGQGFDPSPT